MLHIDTPLLYILSSHLVSCIYSSSGNYNDSLNDAKVATDLQSLLIKAIMGGKIPEKKPTTTTTTTKQNKKHRFIETTVICYLTV